MQALRIDHWRLDAATIEVDPVSGWLTMSGTAALVGVMDYGDHNELVPAQTLAVTDSLVAAPLTIEHPPRFLDLETTRQQQVGTVLSADFDGSALRVRVRVTDADAVAAIQTGKRELSPGYMADIEDRVGVWDGKKYDAIQTGRRYNHLAIVDRARGGRQARLDSLRADGVCIAIEAEVKMNPSTEMVAVTIDGIEYMVPAAVAAALQPAQDAMMTQPNTDPGNVPYTPEELARMNAAPKTDGIVDAVVTKVLTAIRADREVDRRQAAELGETIAVVRPFLPESYRVDGKDVGSIVADAIVAKRPDLEGLVKRHRTDAARLRGMLDAIIDGNGGIASSTDEQRAKIASRADGEDPIEAARKRQDERLYAVKGGRP